MSSATLAIRGRWVLATASDDQPELLTDRYVVIEDGRVAAISRQPPATAQLVEPTAGLVMPGFINLHAHSINAPLFRGLIDDLAPLPRPENLIYRLLMPVGQLAMDLLSEEEIGSLVEMGLREVVRSGTTTVLDMWRPEQEVFFAAARRVGVRAYGAPYIRSRAIVGVDAGGEPLYGADEGEASLLKALSLFERHDEGPDGRLRVALGPHATDTCSSSLLQRVAELAHELNAPATIHLAQSRSEGDVVRRRDGVSPVQLLHRSGLARAGTIAAHCVFADDSDLRLLGSSGTAVAHCPLTFARAGIGVTIDRFWDEGIRTAIGTDAYCMDMLGELRAAGYLSKCATGRSDTATASALVGAATRVAADALGRPDLGRIAPGAAADLAVFDLSGDHLEPVLDPIRTLVWYATPADLHLVMVGGEILHSVEFDRRSDATRSLLINQAVGKVVQAARAQGLIN